jgi:apolipoprotein N-acyltransferase
MTWGVLRFALAVASGFLLWASFPSVSWNWLGWIGLVPLLLALDASGGLRAAALSYVTGLVMFCGLFVWIPTVPAFSWSGYVLLVAYLSLYVMLFGIGVSVVRRHTGYSFRLVAPPLWIGSEYARAHAGFLASPWMLLGHSQYEHPILLQMTSFTGAYGVSFLLVLVNSSVTDCLLTHPASPWARGRSSTTTLQWAYRRSTIGLVFGLGLVGLCLLFGWTRIDESPASRSLRVGVVQGNIPQDRKWEVNWREHILVRHLALTTEAAVHHPDLIVWPETSVPGDLLHDRQLQAQLAHVAHESNSFLLVGSASDAKLTDQRLAGKKFNSMVLISPVGALTGVYRKLVLVPFAEYAPIRYAALWVQEAGAPWQDIVAGPGPTILSAGEWRIGTPICWENVFPDLFRRMAGQGVQLMINATNEAWFGESSASDQLLAMSVFRAVENHVPVVRAANTGISSFIDPYGRITARLTSSDGKALFVEGTLTRDVPLVTDRTFYTAYGDVFGLIQLAICAWLASGPLLARTKLGISSPCPGTSQGEQA